jgi:hypothetical protein
MRPVPRLGHGRVSRGRLAKQPAQLDEGGNKVGDLLLVVIVATSVWVLVDAKTIGVKKGQIQGMGNMGPWSWFLVCLLLWIVGFPFYLAKRPEFKRINGK